MRTSSTSPPRPTPRAQACGNPALDFDGKLFHYRDAELHVKPRQKPYPPLWFPSSNRESIEFTARHGYHTAFLGKLTDCKPHFERYREVWQRHRDDPGRPDVHKTTPYDEDSWQPLIVGSPASALEKVQDMLRVTGANYLLCIFSFGSLAPQAALRSLALFAREILPKLRAVE